MLFGIRRGIRLTLALATTLGLGLVLVSSARADGQLFQHTIPREVDAYNFKTGGPFMAPPVPNGHYSKDYVTEAHKSLSCVTCRLHAHMNGGKGHCFLHKGDGDYGGGGGHGQGGGFGHGDSGVASGIGYGGGVYGQPGESSYGGGIGLANPAYVNGGVVVGVGAGADGFATTAPEASAQFGPVISGQAICGKSDCEITVKHSHLSQMLNKIRCGSCSGIGCGACAGTGATGLCGDPGCSLGAGHSHGDGYGGGSGCPLCGGKGCAKCLSALKSGLGGLHGKLASLTGAFHAPKMQWFLGAGGPVPLTPGYVPYIVATRSPRDFFSFPPMNPNDP
jgi:hypothetical protein